MQNVVIQGNGDINGNGVATIGVFVKLARMAAIGGGGFTVNGCTEQGIYVGDPGAVAASSEITVRDVTVRNAGGANTSTSIGVFYDNASDSIVDNVVAVGYRTGFKNNGGSIFYTNDHAWTLRTYGPMKYGFYINGKGSKLVNCYADTPTNVTDGTITNVFGFYLNTYNIDMVNCRGLLNATSDPAVSESSDNSASGIFIVPADGLFGSIIGCYFSSTNPSVKWKNIISGTGVASYTTNLTMFGINSDGNFYTANNNNQTQGVTNFPSTITLNAALTHTGITNNDSGNGALLAIDPTPADGSSSAVVRLFRGINTSNTGTGLIILKADGTSSSQHSLYAKGNAVFGEGGTGGYNVGHVQIGTFHLWVEAATGKLRIKNSAPSSDADGSVVGVQPATGSGVPGTTPLFIGQDYLDTSGNKWYKAKGTASSADWLILN